MERVENQLAADLNLQPGELLLDFPAKAKLLEVDMPLLKKDGSIEPLGAQDGIAQMGIQHVADELHARARRLRVFTASPCPVDPHSILRLVVRTKNEVESDLGGNLLLPDQS